jgi:hypothetical protein
MLPIAARRATTTETGMSHRAAIVTVTVVPTFGGAK